MKKERNRILLTGFMGTGKTSVGEKLAHKLSYRFFDTDAMVEAEKKKSVQDIFEKEGEAAFRGYENEALRNALKESPVVIASGGGIVLNPENRKLMKNSALVVALTADAETILERIKSSNHRPLLKTENQMQRIKDLLKQRSPYYLEADHLIDTTHLDVDDVVVEIMKVLDEDR